MHSAGVSVAGASMSDGISGDRILLVIEGMSHKGGPSELGRGCVGD